MHSAFTDTSKRVRIQYENNHKLVNDVRLHTLHSSYRQKQAFFSTQKQNKSESSEWHVGIHWAFTDKAGVFNTRNKKTAVSSRSRIDGRCRDVQQPRDAGGRGGNAGSKTEP